MMLLEIELFGICPFKRPKRILLNAGFNTIVGLNGSGKTITYQVLSSLLLNRPFEKIALVENQPARASVTLQTPNGEIYRIENDLNKEAWNLSMKDHDTQEFLVIERKRDKIFSWLCSASGGLGEKDRGLLFMVDRFRFPSFQPLRVNNGHFLHKERVIGAERASFDNTENLKITHPGEAARKEASSKKEVLMSDELELEAMGKIESEMLLKQTEAAEIRKQIKEFDEIEQNGQVLEVLEAEKISFLVSEGTITPERLQSYEEGKRKNTVSLERIHKEKNALKTELILINESKTTLYLLLVGLLLTTSSFLLPSLVSPLTPFRYLFLGGVFGGCGLSAFAYPRHVKRIARKKRLKTKLLKVNKEKRLLEESFRKEHQGILDFIEKTASKDLSELNLKQQDYFHLCDLKQKGKSDSEKMEGLLMGQTIKGLGEKADRLESKVRMLQEKLKGSQNVFQEDDPLQGELQKLESEIESSEIVSGETTHPNLPDIESRPPGIESHPREADTSFLPALLSITGKGTSLSRDLLEQNANILFRRFRPEKIESIQIKESGVVVLGETPLNQLSSGTADQVLFSLSLSAISQFSDSSFPIILDDPFISFDGPSKEVVIEILQVISKKRQVIFLTTQALDIAGDHVFSLLSSC